MAGIAIGGDMILGHHAAVELTDIVQKQSSVGRQSLVANRGISAQSSIAYNGTGTPEEINSFTNSLVNPPAAVGLSAWRTVLVIGTVSTITIVNSMLSGLLVVALPTMAVDLGLPGNLILWPASVNA